MATRAVLNRKLLLISLFSIVVATQSLPVAHAGYQMGFDRNPELQGDTSSASRYRFKRGERCIMRRINRVRARQGLHRLRADKQLGYVAAPTREHDRILWWCVARRCRREGNALEPHRAEHGPRALLQVIVAGIHEILDAPRAHPRSLPLRGHRYRETWRPSVCAGVVRVAPQPRQHLALPLIDHSSSAG